MFAMPEVIAVTVPEVPIVATAVLLLLQVPPGVPLLNEAVPPAQRITGVDGRIAVGVVFTVTVAVTEQVPMV